MGMRLRHAAGAGIIRIPDAVTGSTPSDLCKSTLRVALELTGVPPSALIRSTSWWHAALMDVRFRLSFPLLSERALAFASAAQEPVPMAGDGAVNDGGEVTDPRQRHHSAQGAPAKLGLVAE